MADAGSDETHVPEYSYVVDVASLPATGIERPIRPSDAEMAAVAERLGLQAIERFDIRIAVRPWRGSGARMTASFEADVVQTCVVTLEPVPATVRDEFEVKFLPAKMIDDPKPGQEIDVSPDEDAPEPLGGETGTSFDAGDVTVQYLSLALDPYPRKADAAIPEEATTPEEPSPFAALAALKPNGKDQ
ncbi:DUF177 domain-containing protein [Pyruvatibacter sp. HU-CL02332]|uniref:YceD family protein n=1 Tax=Pyruvatibacter sp. HU-CL02332 TaxID=3127650 RepID=UPI003103525E